jgi:hypothetical protein
MLEGLLIKLMLASIPVYYMSTVLFSKNFVRKITTIIRKFWWAGVQDNPTSPIAYRSWDDICQPKENGGLRIRDLYTVNGLRIRDLYTVNKSLLTQAAWNIATQLYSKPNAFPGPLSGPLTPQVQNPSFGHLFCRSKKNSATILLFKSIQVTHLSGLLLGVHYGTTYMTTCYYRSPSCLCQPLSLTFGIQTPKLGM